MPPHWQILPTTRPISCFTELSRSGVPTWPRKYFETTTLVASCDHDFGIAIGLLEDGVAALVRDAGRAQFPLDTRENVFTGSREMAGHADATHALRPASRVERNRCARVRLCRRSEIFLLLHVALPR